MSHENIEHPARPQPADQLRAALELAANRLARATVDHPPNSEPFLRLSEWTREARAALSQPAPATQPADDLRAAIQWRRTVDGLPKKPGLRDYEQIECLIMMPNGDIEISAWNCEHEVWDDAEGDDYRYDPCKPTHWMALAPICAALSQPAPAPQSSLTDRQLRDQIVGEE